MSDDSNTNATSSVSRLVGRWELVSRLDGSSLYKRGEKQIAGGGSYWCFNGYRFLRLRDAIAFADSLNTKQADEVRS